MKKSVVILELCGSHDECIYSQVEIYFNMGYDVHLIVSCNLNGRFSEYCKLKTIHYFNVGLGRVKDLKTLFTIKSLINKMNPESVIFNTASNSIIMDLLIILGRRYKYYGIIHSLKKLNEGITQKVISRYIYKYFVLNDYLLDFIPKNLKNIEFCSLYTVYSPDKANLNFKQESQDFRICIPGHFEYKRRDYEFLLKLATDKNLDNRIKFILLGNSIHRYSDGNDFKKKSKEYGVYERFVFFDGFISPKEYRENINSSNLIMPLLHPNVDFYKDYLNNQISGTFNLSFTYRKPMLVFDEFNKIEDLRISSFFYNFDNIFEKINNLLNNRNIIIDKSKEINDYHKFKLDTQILKLQKFMI